MKKNRGFSILELLITIAIMGALIVLGLNVGRSALQRSDFNAAINGFIADFSYARQLAARENRYVAIVFDSDGRFYTIRVQRGIGLDLTDTNSYSDDKTVEPLNGEVFFSKTTDFAVNSMGIIRAYPVDLTAVPITITLQCQKKTSSGTLDYKNTLTIFPSGGIKIEQ